MKKLHEWLTNSKHSEFVFSLIISLLTIVLGILISPLGWTKLLCICLGIVNVVFLLILSFWHIIWIYRIREKKEEKIKQDQEQIKRIVETAKNDYAREYGIAGNSLIVRADVVAKAEKGGKYKEIWLVTNDLSTEIGDGDYSGTVLDNLIYHNDVIYRYFIPDTTLAKLRRDRLIESAKIAGKINRRLFFYTLEDNFFSLVPDFDFSIYIHRDASVAREGYMGYVINKGNNRSRNFEIKMTTKFVDAIYAKLNRIKDSSPATKD